MSTKLVLDKLFLKVQENIKEAVDETHATAIAAMRGRIFHTDEATLAKNDKGEFDLTEERMAVVHAASLYAYNLACCAVPVDANVTGYLPMVILEPSSMYKDQTFRNVRFVFPAEINANVALAYMDAPVAKVPTIVSGMNELTCSVVKSHEQSYFMTSAQGSTDLVFGTEDTMIAAVQKGGLKLAPGCSVSMSTHKDASGAHYIATTGSVVLPIETFGALEKARLDMHNRPASEITDNRNYANLVFHTIATAAGLGKFVANEVEKARNTIRADSTKTSASQYVILENIPCVAEVANIAIPSLQAELAKARVSTVFVIPKGMTNGNPAGIITKCFELHKNDEAFKSLISQLGTAAARASYLVSMSSTGATHIIGHERTAQEGSMLVANHLAGFFPSLFSTENHAAPVNVLVPSTKDNSACNGKINLRSASTPPIDYAVKLINDTHGIARVFETTSSFLMTNTRSVATQALV